ncbi:MAG TPA: phospholipid carrier-dependent glycosyltransferase [Thermoanaerobaculia bacterium]|jgi:4-amino-4-deoxy-L-arabinose transferase-like glycosyltransferase|nr:phospholipid carrier-dependent glycosyltransferase [Thermoanaerobaculia bacterium]
MSDFPVSSARSLGAPLGWPARLLLAGAAFLVFFAGLGAYPLLEPDEGRYAEIPREMLASGDFVTPHLNGVLYFEKPPLYYWLNAAALTLPGRPEVLCRLAGAFFGLAGVGLAWALGRAIGGPRVGLISGIVLSSSPLWIALSRAATIDMTLTFFLSATLTCFWLAQSRDQGDRGERLLWYGMFASAALATLAKGLIGFVIPGAVIFFFLLFARRWSILLRVPWVGGILFFLAITVPWHVLAARRNPDFLWFYFVHEHWLRYTTPEADREAPFWFFVPVLLLGLLPWSGLFPATMALFRRRAEPLRRPELIFLGSWAGFIFLFFSASHSKLVPYVLPACLPLAVLVALGLHAAQEEGRARSWIVRGGAIAGAAVLILPSALLLWAAFGKVPELSADFSRILFSFSSMAIATALAAVLWWKKGVEGRGLAALAVASVFFVACIWALGPRVGRQRSSLEIARFLETRLRPGDEVYSYHYYPQSLPVYLKQTIGVVHFRGEMAFGIDHLSAAEHLRRFPTAGEFRPAWESPRTLYLVVERRDLHHMIADGLAPGPILLGQDKLLLMTNRVQAEARVPETHE